MRGWLSGIAIRGDAWTWWGQADDAAYLRGQRPQVGAVLVFKRTNRLHRGHVAVVARIVNHREILVTHANWANRGKVVHNVRVIDEVLGQRLDRGQGLERRDRQVRPQLPLLWVHLPAAGHPARGHPSAAG